MTSSIEISEASSTTPYALVAIGEAGLMTVDQLIEALNSRGFVVSVFQGSYSVGGLVDKKVPKHLWHGSAYSEDRHTEFSLVHRELVYEEQIKLPCFFYHLVAHHHETLEDCLQSLWQQYLSPSVPPRPLRSSPNPAFLRHKKKVVRQPITDDDLLA